MASRGIGRKGAKHRTTEDELRVWLEKENKGGNSCVDPYSPAVGY